MQWIIIILTEGIIFIVVPKNSGLRKYKEKALDALGRRFSKIVEVRGEDVAFLTNQICLSGKKAIGLTGEDLYEEYLLSKDSKEKECITTLKKIEWNDKKAIYQEPPVTTLFSRYRLVV